MIHLVYSSLSLSLSSLSLSPLYPPDCTDEKDVILLKLAHNFHPQLNAVHCSQEVCHSLQYFTVVGWVWFRVGP